MRSNNVDEKINVCITQHTQRGDVIRGNPAHPEDSQKISCSTAALAEEDGGEGVTPNLHSPAKKKGLNMRASVKTFITFTLCLIGR